MNGNKLVSALSYWSVLFAPILFPILVWIVGDSESKSHAKRALWTHILPTVTAIAGFAALGVISLSVREVEVTLGIGSVITVALCGLISVYFFIWNIVKGIQVIKA
ncbi:MAG: DUF4870 domain-containing protein [Paenibacillus dendritiformis]|uniref:DUF4870 domain-containing protein n=1 Tax=Paenibacillus dendritiformis TaxID=130049 RepID=UPI00143DE884|nr:DUF4870 domain-containing protein [Paenibacillus dendritiformis]MDU5145588.1 DUF4870 domain-containing protein [Paenibacillus dendritiformis]NKI22281.1 DUF4870 domain-containing protein [Paenibacillus dendritiformis]NRF98769.1 DUF4870 domain-containing protein [Paenibacillus dendritiformis]